MTAQEAIVQKKKKIHNDLHTPRDTLQSQLVQMMQTDQNHHASMLDAQQKHNRNVIYGFGFLCVSIVVGFLITTYFG